MNKSFSSVLLLLSLIVSSLSGTALAHEVPYHEVIAHNHWLDYFGLIGIGTVLLLLVVRKLFSSR